MSKETGEVDWMQLEGKPKQVRDEFQVLFHQALKETSNATIGLH